MLSTESTCSERGITAIGTSAPNSRRGETGRRFLQAHLARGVDGEIALEAARTPSRVYAELEGRGAALSLDVALAAARHLPLEERVRLAAFWLEPLGLEPTLGSIEPLTERP